MEDYSLDNNEEEMKLLLQLLTWLLSNYLINLVTT